ncbi:MAG: hypothetical protein ACREK6_20625 [Candidatus Rokuibacteriota bacterium]
MDAETRTYLDFFRQEFRRDLAEAMTSMRYEYRADLAEVRQESRADLAEAMATLRAEIRTEAVATRRHFDVVAEGLRGDIRLVAEGVVANTESIERLRSDITREMDARFHPVHLAFADTRREIGELRGLIS